MISELNSIHQLTASVPSKVNFDYFSVHIFATVLIFKTRTVLKSFSVLNCNIRSLNSNFDHLA